MTILGNRNEFVLTAPRTYTFRMKKGTVEVPFTDAVTYIASWGDAGILGPYSEGCTSGDGTNCYDAYLTKGQGIEFLMESLGFTAWPPWCGEGTWTIGEGGVIDTLDHPSLSGISFNGTLCYIASSDDLFEYDIVNTTIDTTHLAVLSDAGSIEAMEYYSSNTLLVLDPTTPKVLAYDTTSITLQNTYTLPVYVGCIPTALCWDNTHLLVAYKNSNAGERSFIASFEGLASDMSTVLVGTFETRGHPDNVYPVGLTYSCDDICFLVGMANDTDECYMWKFINYAGVPAAGWYSDTYPLPDRISDITNDGPHVIALTENRVHVASKELGFRMYEPGVTIIDSSDLTNPWTMFVDDGYYPSGQWYNSNTQSYTKYCNLYMAERYSPPTMGKMELNKFLRFYDTYDCTYAGANFVGITVWKDNIFHTRRSYVTLRTGGIVSEFDMDWNFIGGVGNFPSQDGLVSSTDGDDNYLILNGSGQATLRKINSDYFNFTGSYDSIVYPSGGTGSYKGGCCWRYNGNDNLRVALLRSDTSLIEIHNGTWDWDNSKWVFSLDTTIASPNGESMSFISCDGNSEYEGHPVNLFVSTASTFEVFVLDGYSAWTG